MQRRDDDDNLAHFRTTRTFRDGGQWYFNTREGDVIGPFQDELEAATQIEVYIRMATAGILPTQRQMTLSSLSPRAAL